MPIEIVITGHQAFSRKLSNMIMRTGEALPVMATIITDMERVEEQLFLSQGRRGGGSWKPLAASTIRQKTYVGLDPQINIATGNLLSSLADNVHENAVRRVSNVGVTFGTTARGAKQSKLRRPIFKFTMNDRLRWARWMKEYITGKEFGRV